MGSAVGQAIFDLRHFTRLWLWLYLGRLCLTLLITLPALAMISSSLDRSVYGQALAGEWSLDVLAELILNNPGLVTFVTFLVIFLSLAALLIKQFLNGGIYRTLVGRRTLSRQEFFGYSVYDFNSHLRITLVMLPVYVALAILASLIISIFPRAIFGPQGSAGILSLGAREAILWIFLILGSIFSDFMRISQATAPDQPVAVYWRSAVGLFRRTGVQAIGVYAAFYLPFVILWIVVEIAAVQVTGALQSGLGVMIEFLLFQTCSFARSGQSLLGSAGLAALTQHALPAVPIQPVEDLKTHD